MVPAGVRVWLLDATIEPSRCGPTVRLGLSAARAGTRNARRHNPRPGILERFEWRMQVSSHRVIIITGYCDIRDGGEAPRGGRGWESLRSQHRLWVPWLACCLCTADGPPWPVTRRASARWSNPFV